MKKNLSDFSNYKTIAKFENPKSTIGKILLTNDPDEWFISVVSYKKKSGEIIEDSGWINPNNLESRIRWWATLGWNKI